MRDLTNVFAAIYGSLWAMPEEKMEAMLAFLAMRGDGLPLTADEIRARIGDGQRSRAAAPKGTATAVIPVFGILSHRAHLVRNISGPGGTSTEILGQEFDEAMADDDVGTILFDIDSPGGNVAGIPELASKIYAARGQKRTIAIANATMASAAYWIGSAADELVVTPSADVGSIGVYGIHTDVSRRDANAGITRTIVKAGRYKADGVAGPLSSEAIAHEQRRVDEIYQQFLGAVGSHRKVSGELVREKFGEGRTVSAQQAVALGMADRIATYDQLLAELAGTATSHGRSTARSRAAEDTPPVVASADVQVVVVASEEGVPDAAAIAAAVTASLSANDSTLPQSQAPKAKENPVENQPTGAPSNGAGPDNVLALERQRCAALAQLGRTHKRSQEEVEKWIAAGATPDAVSQEILRSYADGVLPLRVDVGADRSLLKPFASLGDQLVAIKLAGTPGGRVDPRLLQIGAGPTGGTTQDNALGGYLLQPTYAAGLVQKVFEASPIPSRCSRVPLGEGSDRLVVKMLEDDSRADGSRWGGVRVYRRAKAATVDPSKIKFSKWECALEDLMGKAFIENSALSDAPSLQAVYEDGFRKEFDFELTSEILRGTGAGECLGILNSPCLVTVAKKAGQAADTIVPENIVNMYAALFGPNRSNAVWLINQEIEPQLHLMTLGTGTVQLIYMPPGGLSQAPYGTLFGRPVIPVEHCSALGDVGDIILADLSEYQLVEKDGLRSEVSIHVRFEYDESCFKWVMRINGQPRWKKALTRFKGAGSLSPFVTLAERA